MQNDQVQQTILTCADQSTEPPVSIMALHGLGQEIWEGVDAQAYVAGLRGEWERTEMPSPDTAPECELPPLYPNE